MLEYLSVHDAQQQWTGTISCPKKKGLNTISHPLHRLSDGKPNDIKHRHIKSYHTRHHNYCSGVTCGGQVSGKDCRMVGAYVPMQEISDRNYPIRESFSMNCDTRRNTPENPPVTRRLVGPPLHLARGGLSRCQHTRKKSCSSWHIAGQSYLLTWEPTTAGAS